jgi:hypothetical protein
MLLLLVQEPDFENHWLAEGKWQPVSIRSKVDIFTVMNCKPGMAVCVCVCVCVCVFVCVCVWWGVTSGIYRDD